MLHEVFLSLAGHPSALFRNKHGSLQLEADSTILSPSELELLSTVAHLSKLHQDLKAHVEVLVSQHPSSICRAVASIISSSQLTAFQEKIINVEKSILQNDSAVVGAYKIVPLAGVVGEFSESTRLMEWLWSIACFMKPASEINSEETCSGPTIINKLKHETQTGYPDIEDAANHLQMAAEHSWLRQLSTWILYGTLSPSSKRDFFIQSTADETGRDVGFHVKDQLLPHFVTAESSASVLFVGQTLCQLRLRKGAPADASPDLQLLQSHQGILASLRSPLSSVNVSAAVNSIRTSLSQNVLRRLLPVENVLQLLRIMRQYFLLSSGDFAVCLVQEADDAVRTRGSSSSSKRASATDVRAMVMKEGEVNAVLSRSWARLAALQDDETDIDDDLDLAMDLLRLTIATPSSRRKPQNDGVLGQATTSFGDFLFPTPTALGLNVVAPFDLFMTPGDAKTYASIHSLLLSIRRAHLHLADLWKQTSLRRDHPTPLGPPRSCTTGGRQLLQKQRQRKQKRQTEMRKVWATCGAALFLFVELEDYFQRQVIEESFKSLVNWIQYSPTDSPHDPATLSVAHQSFLRVLLKKVLLADGKFSSRLRALLAAVDNLIAQILRLQHAQRNMDLEEDEGVIDGLTDHSKELADCQIDLDRARKQTDSACKDFIDRLRDLSGFDFDDYSVQGTSLDDSEFVPFHDARVERLLMKLDFSRGDDDCRSETEKGDD
jgi:hypothetical protein